MSDEQISAGINDRADRHPHIITKFQQRIIGGNQTSHRIEHYPIADLDPAVLPDFQINHGHQRDIVPNYEILRFFQPQNEPSMDLQTTSKLDPFQPEKDSVIPGPKTFSTS